MRYDRDILVIYICLQPFTYVCIMKSYGNEKEKGTTDCEFEFKFQFELWSLV